MNEIRYETNVLYKKEQRAISACYITFIARPLTNENARFRFNAKYLTV